MSQLDRSLFLYLNGLHSSATDPLWVFITSNWFWIFFFVPVAYFLFKKYGKKSFMPALCVPLLFLLADQGTNLIKNYFERLRPCQVEDLLGLIHFLAPHCGLYGFWSAHAANSFAQITFFMCLGIIPHGIHRKLFYPYFILFATLVSLSRVMVGVHYPGDILFGMIYGILCGLLVYVLFKYILKKLNNNIQPT